MTQSHRAATYTMLVQSNRTWDTETAIRHLTTELDASQAAESLGGKE
jgi:hypothetical protein